MNPVAEKKIAQSAGRDTTQDVYCDALLKVFSAGVAFGTAIVCRADQFDAILSKRYPNTRVDIEEFHMWNTAHPSRESLYSHFEGGAQVYDRDGNHIF